MKCGFNNNMCAPINFQVICTAVKRDSITLKFYDAGEMLER